MRVTPLGFCLGVIVKTSLNYLKYLNYLSYVNYVNYLNYLNYLSYLKYLNYLLLVFDKKSSRVKGRDGHVRNFISFVQTSWTTYFVYIILRKQPILFVHTSWITYFVCSYFVNNLIRSFILRENPILFVHHSKKIISFVLKFIIYFSSFSFFFSLNDCSK